MWLTEIGSCWGGCTQLKQNSKPHKHLLWAPLLLLWHQKEAVYIVLGCCFLLPGPNASGPGKMSATGTSMPSVPSSNDLASAMEKSLPPVDTPTPATYEPHNIWWTCGVTLMSLLIKYSPMASYFRLSTIFLPLWILRHLPHWCNVLCDHHRLYPIPITLSAQHQVVDFAYDLWTTQCYFPFLVPFLLPDVCCRRLTDHKPSHHMVRALPSISPHTNLVLILLIICI